MSIEESIDRSTLGDPNAWLDEHGDALFRYALLRVSSRELAEDLVQETPLAALRAREQFQGQSSERTWFVAILRRKIVDHTRKVSREQSADLSENLLSDLFNKKGNWKQTLAKWSSDPVQVFENREFWDIFHKCVSKLPPAFAEAFLLRELDECNAAETCSIQGISATNLSTRLYRARILLRRCLEVNWFALKR